MDNRETLRIKVAREYLNNRESFRQTALKFHIAYCTVFRWVKLYRKYGEERLLSTYKKPWNRASPELEERIVLMKEHEPGLTVRKAKEYLEKEDVNISVKGIWGIWKRYGYAGFSQRNMTGNYTSCSWSKEATKKYALAELFHDRGLEEKAAGILNSIPALPANELLPRIPDSLLTIRRKVEKMELQYGKIPVQSYLENVQIIYKECRRRGMCYSAFITGLVETMTLSWSGEPSKMLNKVAELREMIEKDRSYFSYLLRTQRLLLLVAEGFACSGLMKIEEALVIAKKCRKLLKRRKHIDPYFMRHLGQLFTQLEDCREAEYWYLRSMDKLGERETNITKFMLADILIMKGECRKALHICRNAQSDYWATSAQQLRIKYVWSLVKGMPAEALSLTTEALAVLKREETKAAIFSCYFTIASAYCSLGERTRARRVLRDILPFIAKNRLANVKTIIEIILAENRPATDPMLSCEHLLPSIKLALLLKNRKYTRALKYAEEKGITGLLYRYVVFFPEAVIPLLEKGKPTGLPRAMLNLPVFRKEIPVYSVRFLGNLVVYKNQKYLRVKLAPQDTAFLIHLATTKNRYIALDRIYDNFWPNSKNPARNLAHLLVRIRKTLCLPSHFLYVKNNRLCFDCHFITDYGEHLEHLAQAKAFAVAGEWAFARKEYLHAFSLFRNEPFKKMYDNASEDLHHAILSNLESEAAKFCQACAENGDREQGIATRRRLARIIPHVEAQLQDGS